MNRLSVVSWSGESFADREEAGQLLGEELKRRNFRISLVLGIPRGGAVVARVIAKVLDVEWDIVLAHKLAAPGNSELAIGAIGEGGTAWLNQQIVGYVGADESYLRRETEQQKRELERRSKLIRSIRPRLPVKGRRVLVTDDGIATGATMIAALQSVRTEQPEFLLAALPVGAEDSIARLEETADEIICLRVPSFFQAVGQFYRQFDQVEDEDLIRILKD